MPSDRDNDPFRPPEIPILVHCIHCDEEYESFRIQWVEETGPDGKAQGFWRCPMPDCDGAGFGFDIFPVDPEFYDERGGWVDDDDEEGDEEGDDDDWEEGDWDDDDDDDGLLYLEDVDNPFAEPSDWEKNPKRRKNDDEGWDEDIPF